MAGQRSKDGWRPQQACNRSYTGSTEMQERKPGRENNCRLDRVSNVNRSCQLLSVWNFEHFVFDVHTYTVGKKNNLKQTEALQMAPYKLLLLLLLLLPLWLLLTTITNYYYYYYYYLLLLFIIIIYLLFIYYLLLLIIY